MRQYKHGYEGYFSMLPVLHPDDPNLDLKVHISGSVVKALALDLLQNAPWVFDRLPENEFRRTIIAVEDPTRADNTREVTGDAYSEYVLQSWLRSRHGPARSSETLKEGSELLVAQWGPGFKSPVHGHASGLLHEEILYGKILVNQFRWVRDGVVRPVRSDIAGKGTLISSYAPPDERGIRMGLIHNFVAAEPSASVHYVAEHTRDGRDNSFLVEHFHEVFYMDKNDVTQITGDEGRLLRPGDVAMVRSANVPEYGDHYIVITGPPVLKEHGLRPQDIAIAATPKEDFPGNMMGWLLDNHEPQMGVVLLKLQTKARSDFLEFHGIQVDGSTVIFPEVK
jgi:hypothetical protein